jgi:endo-1,4-beta-xylanase
MKPGRTLAAVAAIMCTGTLAVAAPSAPASAASVVVLTSDFDDGTTQGWFARGPSAVAASTEAARGGGHSLASTQRVDTWQGPGRDMRGVLVKGATYVVEAYVRLAPGQAATPIHMTVQRTPEGGSTVFERVASTSVGDADWVLLRGEYGYAADGTELQLYLESASATVSFFVDDVTVTETAPAPGGPPDEAGVTADFEAGTRQGWAPRIGSEQLTVTDADAHTGTRSLLTTNRQQVFSGPARNVLGRLGKGKTYTFSLWLKLAPGEAPAQLRFSIERRSQGTPSFETVVGNQTVTDGAWVRFTNQYTLAHDVDFLAVYAESASGTPSFYLDDFEMVWLRPLPIQTDIPRVKDVLDFPIGTALDRTETVGLQSDLLRRHFDSVTPGNALKWDSTEPTEGQFAWTEPDAQVGFGVQNGLRVRGHTLVWHNQTPAWVFQRPDGTPLTASPEDRALLLSRLENHIRAVVGRYRDQISSWDVVNEVVDEFQPDGLRRSRWYEVTGLDYIRTAFRVAHEVAPEATLFLNDFNTELPRKREAAFRLVSQLRAEGVPVQGVGHQVHINVVRPVSDVERTIQRFAELGVVQEVTELDISVYTNFTESFSAVPAEVLVAQGYQYRDLFDVFRRQRAHLNAVTIWGVSDANTWLKTFPFPRLDQPLLFDELLQAKPAYWGVVDPSRLPNLTRTALAPAGQPTVDGKRELEWDLLPERTFASASGLAAGFQLRQAAHCLFVLVEVDDTTSAKADTVELFVGGSGYRIERGGRHSPGITAKTAKTARGYRVEAALPLPAQAPFGFDIRVRDTARPGESLSWNDQRHEQNVDTSRRGSVSPVDAVARVDAPRGTPVIDAVADPVWTRARGISTGVQVLGTGGATATAKVLWDAGHVYVFVTVTDPVLDEGSANAHEQDSVEIFVDPENNKSVGYNDDDGQYRISFSNRQTVGGNFDAFAIGDNLVSATRTVPGGYIVEAAIALDTVEPADGVLLGFDLQVNDATAAARTAVRTWHDPTGLSFLNTSRWGVVRLVRR